MCMAEGRMVVKVIDLLAPPASVPLSLCVPMYVLTPVLSFSIYNLAVQPAFVAPSPWFLTV